MRHWITHSCDTTGSCNASAHFSTEAGHEGSVTTTSNTPKAISAGEGGRGKETQFSPPVKRQVSLLTSISHSAQIKSLQVKHGATAHKHNGKLCSLYAGLLFSKYTVDTKTNTDSPVLHSWWLTSWKHYFSSLRLTLCVFLSGLRLRASGLRATAILGSITTHTFQVPLLWALEWCCFTEAAPPVMRISDQSSRKFCCWSDTKSTFRFWKGFSRGCLWRSRRNSTINNIQQPFCRETRVHVNAFKSPAEGITPFPLSLNDVSSPGSWPSNLPLLISRFILSPKNQSNHIPGSIFLSLKQSPHLTSWEYWIYMKISRF